MQDALDGILAVRDHKISKDCMGMQFAPVPAMPAEEPLDTKPAKGNALILIICNNPALISTIPDPSSGIDVTGWA